MNGGGLRAKVFMKEDSARGEGGRQNAYTKAFKHNEEEPHHSHMDNPSGIDRVNRDRIYFGHELILVPIS